MLKNRFKNMSNREVLGILIAVALASSGLSLVVNTVNNVDTTPGWWVSWLQNFSTEMFGAFLTFILLELVVGSRQQREAEMKAERLQQEAELKTEGQLKQRLIIQMRSTDNGIALLGLEEMREHGWVSDGSLEGAHLQGANLQRADLEEANLKEVHLDGANLQGADLEEANLQRGNLHGANLKGADLEEANLKEIHLEGANLQGANLEGADFQGANLDGADFQGAKLQGAKFDKNTRLPDMSYWTPETDMTEFTQPEDEAGSS